jgi:molybdopterin-containing oxidoreductase family membrane subunit
VAINDVKEDLTEGSDRYIELPPEEGPPPRSVRKANSGVLGVFASAEHLVEAVRNLRRSELDSYETYSPVRVRQAEAMMGARHNPVRYWTLAGAILGATGGFALAIGSALVNGLIAGGKQPISMVPYCVIGFEGLILTGALFNLGAVVGYARLGRRNVPRWYDTRFSCDRFGLFVACPAEQFQHARTLLGQAGAEEIRAFE